MINPRFQVSFIAYFVMFFVVSQAFLYVAVSAALDRVRDTAGDFPPATMQIFNDLLARQQGMLTTVYLVTSLTFDVIMIIIGVLVSHRVAGPLYRVKIHFNKIAETGELKDLSFRQTDYFQEIPETFNRFLAKLRQLR